MSNNNAVDISENDISFPSADLLNILLFDRTTRRNIIWATGDYESCGDSYHAKFPIVAEQITGERCNIIQPRVTKAIGNQLLRTKDKAEVFTPSWLCNIQNNLIDAQWFGKEHVFNHAKHGSWKATPAAIVFPEGKGRTWQKYVDEKRLEITCGEAPYLVSRYDTVTGEAIPLPERIGLLDRKLRVVNENISDEKEWMKWTKRAFESVYGFEYQGDSLLLARENLLFTFVDYFKWKFQRAPAHGDLKDIALIISWNIWQMDGLTFTVPFQGIYEQYHQLALDEGAEDASEPCYCKIRDWRSKETLFYRDLVRKEGR